MDTHPEKYNHVLLSNIQDALFKAIRGKSPEKDSGLINAILEPLLPSILEGKDDEFHDALSSLYCRPKSVLKAAVSAITDTLMDSPTLPSNFERTLLRYITVEMKGIVWRKHEKHKKETYFSEIEGSCKKLNGGDDNRSGVEEIMKIKHSAFPLSPQDEVIQNEIQKGVREELLKIREELVQNEIKIGNRIRR